MLRLTLSVIGAGRARTENFNGMLKCTAGEGLMLSAVIHTDNVVQAEVVDGTIICTATMPST